MKSAYCPKVLSAATGLLLLLIAGACSSDPPTASEATATAIAQIPTPEPLSVEEIIDRSEKAIEQVSSFIYTTEESASQFSLLIWKWLFIFTVNAPDELRTVARIGTGGPTKFLESITVPSGEFIRCTTDQGWVREPEGYPGFEDYINAPEIVISMLSPFMFGDPDEFQVSTGIEGGVAVYRLESKFPDPTEEEIERSTILFISADEFLPIMSETRNVGSDFARIKNEVFTPLERPVEINPPDESSVIGNAGDPGVECSRGDLLPY